MIRLLLLLSLLMSLGARADTHAGYFTEPKPLDAEGFREVFVQVAPKVYMAGQPDAAVWPKLKDMGVTTVVNLRTDMEMDNREVVPYDEAGAVAALSMTYVHLPSGGPDTPYSPAVLDRFAQALEEADGKVLLHCTVAWRATHLWAAYLIKHQQVPFAEAIDIARQLNLGNLPLEGFLGQPLTIGPK